MEYKLQYGFVTFLQDSPNKPNMGWVLGTPKCLPYVTVEGSSELAVLILRTSTVMLDYVLRESQSSQEAAGLCPLAGTLKYKQVGSLPLWNMLLGFQEASTSRLSP